MAMNSRPAIANWLEQLSQLQADGNFLVRPLGRIPLVYEVNAVAKDRLISFQMSSRRISFVVVFGALAAIAIWHLTLPWVLLALFLVSLVAYVGGLSVILARGKRVPSSRWKGAPPTFRLSRGRSIYL